jgi:hypothetical protein
MNNEHSAPNTHEPGQNLELAQVNSNLRNDPPWSPASSQDSDAHKAYLKMLAEAVQNVLASQEVFTSGGSN